MVKKCGENRQREENPLFEKREVYSCIAGKIQYKRDLYRYVRWPEYALLQRKRRVLLNRLKVPPPINQFRNALGKFQAASVFKFLSKYRPESRNQKRNRLESEKTGQHLKPKPFHLKYGLQHITHLVEKNLAKFVVIAHDVDPIELVLWLPALCRTMGIPYVIVKGKAELGLLTHKKTCTAVALTDVRKEDSHYFEFIVNKTKPLFNENPDVNKWGGWVLGVKSLKKLEEKLKNVYCAV